MVSPHSPNSIWAGQAPANPVQHHAPTHANPLGHTQAPLTPLLPSLPNHVPGHHLNLVTLSGANQSDPSTIASPVLMPRSPRAHPCHLPMHPSFPLLSSPSHLAKSSCLTSLKRPVPSLDAAHHRQPRNGPRPRRLWMPSRAWTRAWTPGCRRASTRPSPTTVTSP